MPVSSKPSCIFRPVATFAHQATPRIPSLVRGQLFPAASHRHFHAIDIAYNVILQHQFHTRIGPLRDLHFARETWPEPAETRSSGRRRRESFLPGGMRACLSIF